MSSSITLTSFEGARFEAPYGEGTVRFGDSADQVCAVLGQPENDPSEETLLFHDCAVQVHIGENGVHFFEFATNPKKDGVDVVWNEHNLSQMNAVTCAELLQELNGDAEVCDDEAPAGYVFEKLGLSVWQPVALQTAIDEYEEAKASDADEEELEYLAEDAAKAEHFDSVGIGSEEYIKQYF